MIKEAEVCNWMEEVSDIGGLGGNTGKDEMM